MEIEERKELQERADRYYREWNIARRNLEISARGYAKKVALLVVIGLSLIFIFRILSGSKPKKNHNRRLMQ